MFLHVWCVMVPMGRLLVCLGRLGHQNHPKRVPQNSLLMSLFDTCSIKKRHPERDGSQVEFSLFFLWFSGGSDPRSARAGVVETQFSIFDVASKGVSFLFPFW